MRVDQRRSTALVDPAAAPMAINACTSPVPRATQGEHARSKPGRFWIARLLEGKVRAARIDCDGPVQRAGIEGAAPG